jgi:hypothetical protein
MGSVVSKSGRIVAVAPVAAGNGRGLRALALARWLVGTWRGLVKSVGTQAYYLVGPSPWMVRDLGRLEDRGVGVESGEAGGR